jgi:PilZ domain
MTNWLGRRRLPRYPIVLPVRHGIAGSDQPRPGAGWTRDLSEAGGCLELSERFEPATVLELHLRGDLGRISVEATVAWLCQAGEPGAILHGVSFRPLSVRERERLHGLLIRKQMVWQGVIRIPMDLPVTCQMRGRSRPPFHGRTENASRGGLLLRLPVVCGVGTPLEVTLRTPDGPLGAEGTVVRVEPRDAQVPGIPIGHGFRFTGLSAAAQMGLSRILVNAP